MNVVIASTIDNSNTLPKTYAEIANVDGTLKDGTSVLDPVIDFVLDNRYFNANYMYIPTFGRYYFIRNIEVLTGNIVRITGHVDVLNSYYQEIVGLVGVVKRNETVYNMYLDDPRFQVYAYNQIQTRIIPGSSLNPQSLGTTNYCFVLQVASGGVSSGT